MFRVVREGIIVDVIKELEWVTFRPDKQIVVRTQEQYALGVISSDGSTIFHLMGRPNIFSENYNSVTLVEITEEEAIELRQILDGTGTDEIIIENEEGEEVLEVLPTEQIYPKVPFTELQAMVQVLVDKVDKLEDENSRLKEIIEVGGGVSNE